MEERRRVLLQPLPPSATQADRGAQIYNLVCSACHAYSGEGLTDAWRSTWAPEDQNCWQAKCHAPNHPPDGFEIPRYVPPAVGPAVTARFRTALDLYEYVRTTMPWHEPGSLLDEQYWDITAYLLRLMAADQGSMTLDGQNAARVELPRPQGEPKTATPSPTATLAATVGAPPHAPTKPPKAALAEAPARAGLLLPVWLLVLGLAVVCVVGAVFLVVARSRRHR